MKFSVRDFLWTNKNAAFWPGHSHRVSVGSVRDTAFGKVQAKHCVQPIRNFTSSDPFGLRVQEKAIQSSPLGAKVAILLCTHQGQKFLQAQLESFVAQTHKNWELWASDDASDDHTLQILTSFQTKIGTERLSVHRGPNVGFCANFLSLACKADISADYYAYSDQDDIWKPEKLERALAYLQTVPAHVPALYCSRTELVDAEGNHLGYSPLFHKPPSFKNALVQSIGGGNTMVFNEAARLLLIQAGVGVQVVTHDWWAYQLISGAGGEVFYDAFPSLLYRQHDNNLVGMNASWTARFKRMRMLWQGRFRDWNADNIRALNSCAHMLASDSLNTLNGFEKAREKKGIQRILAIRRSGVYRQTFAGNLGLITATVLGKI